MAPALDLPDMLLVHAAVFSLVLGVVFVLLRRQGLFRPTTTGFWVWLALMLYLVISPVASLLQQNLDPYALPLEIAGGTERMLWIMVVACVGTGAFFFSYLRTRPRTITWGLPLHESRGAITWPQWAVLAACIAIGLYSLITYRSGIAGNTGTAWQDGRFVGSTTGYQYSAHLLLFVPILFLMQSRTRRWRLTGLGLGLLYVGVSALDPWGRYLVISMMLAITLMGAGNSRASLRRWMLVGATVLLGIVLALRGHQSFRSGQQFTDLVQRAPSQLLSVLGGGDTSMLGGWYLQSYLNDTLVGYDYGIPIVNYALLGPFPNRFFPEKYMMIDWLHSRQPQVTNVFIRTRMNGAKSTIMGSFYAHGGIFAVVPLMLLCGYLARRLDGLLQPDSPPIVRAVGIAYLSTVWMDVGSDDYWILMQFGMFLVPGLLLYAVSRQRAQTVTRPVTRRRGRDIRTEPPHTVQGHKESPV